MTDLITRTYFTTDGTYGTAREGEDIIILDTTDWSVEMWDEIDGASDNERMWLASHFANGQHPLEIDEDGKPKCKVCFFEPQHLNERKINE